MSPLPLKNVTALALYFHETLQTVDWLKLVYSTNHLTIGLNKTEFWNFTTIKSSF